MIIMYYVFAFVFGDRPRGHPPARPRRRPCLRITSMAVTADYSTHECTSWRRVGDFNRTDAVRARTGWGDTILSNVLLKDYKMVPIF